MARLVGLVFDEESPLDPLRQFTQDDVGFHYEGHFSVKGGSWALRTCAISTGGNPGQLCQRVLRCIMGGAARLLLRVVVASRFVVSRSRSFSSRMVRSVRTSSR